MRIVVLSYDLPQHTSETVDSVLNFVRPEQVILVHNGSSRKNVLRLQEKFPALQHLVIEKNCHFSGGANRGLRFAFSQTEWVLFLTNDCRLLQLGKIPEQPGLFAPLIAQRKANQIDSIGGFIEPVQFKLHHAKSIDEFNKSSLRYIPGTAFWMHQTSFHQLSGFDESFQTYWEDVDLSMRALKFGISLNAQLDCHIEHGIGKTCHSQAFYTTYLYQRNRRKMIAKYARYKTPAYWHWSRDNLRMLSTSLMRRDFHKFKLGLRAWID